MRLLSGICARLGIEPFNPHDRLTTDDHFAGNRHFNAQGHATCAERLAQFLIAKGLVPH